MALVLPCYNEEAVLEDTSRKLNQKLDQLVSSRKCSEDSYMVFVDDGSTDGTWMQLSKISAQYGARVRALKLAVNAGHQFALVAGLDYVTDDVDVSISLDADLQHDIDKTDFMLEKYKDGSEIVLGIRESRDLDTLFKKLSSDLYYKFLLLMGVKIARQHSDFRLMSNNAMRNLKIFPEYHVFLRGMPFLLHNKVSRVMYSQSARRAGELKYTLTRMLSLAWNGVTSFSVMPLRLISITGISIFFLSSCLAAYAIFEKLFGSVVLGWASITAPLYALCGIIMLSIGIVGEYARKNLCGN